MSAPYEICSFRLDRKTNMTWPWPPWTILNSDWQIFHKSSLKPLAQMEPRLAGSNLCKILYECCSFCPDRTILNSDWLSFQKSPR